MTEPITGALTDADLVELGARDYLGYVRQFDATPGVSILDLGGVTVRHAPDLANEYLSSVFGTEVHAEVVDDRIHAVIELLGRDGRSFYWPVWPTDRPADLHDRLLAAGFVEDGSAPIMALDLAAPRPPVALAPELEVREADEPELDEIAAFATGSVTDDPAEDLGPSNPFRQTFLRLARETPPRWRFFGGWLEGRLVACAALYTGGGVAGIYAVATDETVRGRGFGRSVTHAAIEAGRAAGHRWSMLMASDLGQPVYLRLGFREVGRARFVRWPGSASQ